MDEKTPPIPKVYFSAFNKRRDKMFAAVDKFTGQRLEGDTFHRFVDTLHSKLPHGVLRDTVFRSVKSTLKKEMTSDQLYNLCWRLSSNIDTLLDNEQVIQWHHQEKLEWVLAEVCGVKTYRRANRFSHQMKFQSLMGSVVPMKLTQFWSSKKLKYLATYRDQKGYGFGFGKSKIDSRGEQRGRSLFHDASQFFGLRCFLLLDPDRSKDYPEFSEVGHSSFTSGYNKGILKWRCRLTSRCVKGFPSNPECHCCPLGKNDCGFATHETTYSLGVCPDCGEKQFIDTTDNEYPECCVRCASSKRIR